MPLGIIWCPELILIRFHSTSHSKRIDSCFRWIYDCPNFRRVQRQFKRASQMTQWTGLEKPAISCLCSVKKCKGLNSKTPLHIVNHIPFCQTASIRPYRSHYACTTRFVGKDCISLSVFRLNQRGMNPVNVVWDPRKVDRLQPVK